MQRMFRLLRADEIEVKVKQVKEKGAVALIYKTSRVDMDILDETLGAENWQDDYKEIKGNLYCGIGIRTKSDQPFIWKWDCGIESREDEEGNEKKGEASDAFKRAGVKHGIGRELYSSPFIFLNVETVTDGKKYKLKNLFESYVVSHIAYDDKNKIAELTIKSSNGKVVFSYPKRATGETESNNTTAMAQNTHKTDPKTDNTRESVEKLTKTELVTVWGVTSAEETLAWLERKIGYYIKDWTPEEHKTAREFLQAEKNRREAEKSKMRESLQSAAGELPFDMGGE